MIELPETAGVAVLRIDFSNDVTWRDLQVDLVAPDYTGTGYEPVLDFVERPDLSGTSVANIEEQLPRNYPSSYEYPFVIVVDDVAINDPEHPVLLIDLSEAGAAGSFRALPREIALIDANLAIANMDFAEFGDSADEDGVFRGFE